MVDFRKKLVKNSFGKPIDPIVIYDTLDRASDKGELRRVQESILKLWDTEFRKKRDVILKLHTGQGKTLIGLLILQSKLNEGSNSAIYLCPDNYLIDQTCTQAKQFGIRFCRVSGELPQEFLDGKSILITSVQKLFNGRTKFELGQRSIQVDALLMDDCHACIDAIRDAFTIKFDSGDTCYQKLVNLFSPALESQGAGSFAEIRNGNSDALLPIPYWDWQDKLREVVAILSDKVEGESQKKPKDGKFPNRHSIWFVWPLILDSLQDCVCNVSGGALEIAPRIAPLDIFGSFYKATHRVFMSATVTDDSFLVKGLRLSSETIKNPLVFKKEKWSGEKMILIPSLINDTLGRQIIVPEFARKRTGREYGVVALVPSFGRSKDWQAYGATVATKDTMYDEIEKLKSVNCDSTLVIVNRYDGVDLPDDACRVLVLDSKPTSDNLVERYEERCRPNSVVTVVRTTRSIEQGLGRSVRGEKDYCAILVMGPQLVRMIRTQSFRKHFSKQTQAQIEIGLEIADLAKEEIQNGETPLNSLHNLIKQCLVRDEGWKAFYVEKMDAIAPNEELLENTLEIYKSELEAELKFQGGDANGAVKTIQALIDQHIKNDADVGWYLQEMARFSLAISKAQANNLQLEAHKKNKFLIKPATGMVVSKLPVSHARMGSIINWVRACGTYEQLNNTILDILAALQFGVGADRFERAVSELGEAIGFSVERPDKEWKEGPDNLWGLEDGYYLLVECKSKVALDRAEIVKDETGQMNNACAWFSKNYPGCKAANILIIPPIRLGRGCGFNQEVQIMRERELKALHTNVKGFFAEFQNLDFNGLLEVKVQEFVNLQHLTVKNVVEDYCVKPRD
jgi:replicative superfamily II helicase